MRKKTVKKQEWIIIGSRTWTDKGGGEEEGEKRWGRNRRDRRGEREWKKKEAELRKKTIKEQGWIIIVKL